MRGVNGMGPGQLCLTNPEARDFIFREMKARIEKERTGQKKAGKQPPAASDSGERNFCDFEKTVQLIRI